MRDAAVARVNILGSMLVATSGLAALSREELTGLERRAFFLYIDEFQISTTLAFVSLMPELHSLLGNAGTPISFRAGPEDARVIAQEMQPVFVRG